MPKTGDEIVYRCLMGHRWDATIIAIHLDGRVDIEVDVGVKDRVSWTRIPFVEPCELKPGMCAIGRRQQEG